MSDFGKQLMSRCMDFSLNIIGIYKYLCDEKKEFVISKQLLRSGISIGANLAEAQNAISKKDFVAKAYIALKESSETKYWIELLYRAQYISAEEYNTLMNDCIEIEKILTSIEKTALQNISSKQPQQII